MDANIDTNLKQNKKIAIKQKFVFKDIIREFTKNGGLYLMTLPGILYLILFKYLPLGGIVIAFKNYSIKKGIWGSEWVGLKNFEFFVGGERVWQVIRNTICLNLSFIIINLITSILLAILLNEIRVKWYKKITQSVIILPHFISWIIGGFIVYSILNYHTGFLGNILQNMGMEKIDVYSKPNIWPFIFVIINNWKCAGFGSIIYLATIAGISSEYYEAATIDGASRFQKLRYITVPLLLPTASVMTLLSIGSILNADFGMFYAIVGDNAMLFKTGDVVDTYVFRALRVVGDVSMASAVSFLQSTVGLVLVLSSNYLANRYFSDGALF